MVPLFQRILKLSGKYRGRIETAFLFSVLKAILSKMPLCVAFLMLSRFLKHTKKTKTVRKNKDQNGKE